MVYGNLAVVGMRFHGVVNFSSSYTVTLSVGDMYATDVLISVRLMH